MAELVMVMKDMSDVGFDFVGEAMGSDDKFIHLKNALVIDYGKEGSLPRLAPLHLPVEMIDVEKGYLTSLPFEATAYITKLPDCDDWIHREFNKFWTTKLEE